MSEIDEATDAAALIEAYYEAGWTDGLPVVPPSDASIAAMLAAAGLDGHEELGALPGRNAIVIADKAATNAVMAGRPPPDIPGGGGGGENPLRPRLSAPRPAPPPPGGG